MAFDFTNNDKLFLSSFAVKGKKPINFLLIFRVRLVIMPLSISCSSKQMESELYAGFSLLIISARRFLLSSDFVSQFTGLFRPNFSCDLANAPLTIAA